MRPPETTTRTLALCGGIVAIVIALLMGIGWHAAGRTSHFGFDVEWMSFMADSRSPVWEGGALALHVFGAGMFAFGYSLVIFTALLLLRGPWTALFFGLSALISVGVVRLLKDGFARDRPDGILVEAEFGSFPSGHSARAAMITVVLAILIPRVWVWVLLPIYTVAMMLSRTYLGAHWLSDTIGGALVGASITLIVWAALAGKIAAEPPRRREDADN